MVSNPTFFRQDSGVPQGSVLGPLFFNIYINDIVESLDLPCLLFADDMKVYSLIGCYDDALRLQDGIDDIVRWCVDNNLHLNCAKCKVVSFTKKTKPLLFNYNINGRILSRSNLVRDLGVIFDSRLSFTDHIESIVNSSFKSLGFVLSMANCIDIH
jgi:ribonuclease P/MRP protein subunit RPP40